jgi:hypothetical protein
MNVILVIDVVTFAEKSTVDIVLCKKSNCKVIVAGGGPFTVTLLRMTKELPDMTRFTAYTSPGINVAVLILSGNVL